MIARTTLGTHNPRISAQTVTHRLRENGERPAYTMYVLYAAFLFWPSICVKRLYRIHEPQHRISNNVVCATSKDQPAHTCSLIRAFISHLNIL